METIDKVRAVRDYMAQTSGSESLHRHWTGRVRMTDGVRFVADACGAHWLVDVVASWQTRRKVAAEPFQVWTLAMEGADAVARATDGNDGKVACQVIGYTDFPAELMPFKLFLEDGVLMLPEER